MTQANEPRADVEVVLTAEYAGRNQEAVALLKAHGLEVQAIDDDNGVIEGVIAENLLGELKSLACVANVRTVFDYLAGSGEPEDEQA
jgi:hypothetical protein